jgi:pimeloyl-ACP methyl ester carboxylesterase
VGVVRCNGIDICYETSGDPADPVLLLVSGLGAQLIDWPDGFVEALAGRGFHVVRYDNRDVGRSALLDELGVPDLAAILAGDAATVPYLLADLAEDAVGLLKALGVDRAHVVGVSMGGMIAQQLTIDHPGVVASLCSIMSTTGDRTVGTSTPEALAVLMRPPAVSRAEVIANGVAGARVLGSPAYPAPRELLEQRYAAKYDRAYRPQGGARHYAAIIASPDRTPGLRAVRVPTLVIHGADDPLITVSGGTATAEAVPGAELLVIPGMGHDLPQQLWDRIADVIAANAARA